MEEAISDSIVQINETLELTDEVKELFDNRIESHQNNPEEGSCWADVKARIRNQF